MEANMTEPTNIAGSNGGPLPEERQRIRDWVEKYRTRLFLHSWFIDIEYPMQDEPADPDGSRTMARVFVSEEYMKARIQIFPYFFERSLYEQEAGICHELCHCLTEQVADSLKTLTSGGMVPEGIQRQEIERLTQWICVIAMHGRQTE
jgi:hypothetical protein